MDVSDPEKKADSSNITVITAKSSQTCPSKGLGLAMVRKLAFELNKIVLLVKNCQENLTNDIGRFQSPDD
ncbi:hypothetical protein CWATWH8502_492 [Crocosphaera watsonii WH 8502]|uniref:Uncharacterized protein n=1 Tax=Crocosphaera watsonii WH 8502 TaxID=423474 RepID=T2I9M3_CROWT|nr:hypothetical protein CWATWH8502_492 [Crocosphaera watsonii WH 8502]